MNSRDPNVKANAVRAFARMHSPPQEAIPYLVDALKDRDGGVMVSATHSLGAMGPAAKKAVPNIVSAFKNASPIEREMVGNDLLNILQKIENLNPTELRKKIRELENIREIIFGDFNDYPQKNLRDRLDTIIHTYEARQPSWFNELITRLRENPKALAVVLALAGYVALLAVVVPIWFLLLFLRPLWLYRLNEKVSWWSFKKFFEQPIGLHQFLLLSPFVYCKRALDAWVQSYRDHARTSFATITTIQDMAAHVPIPISLNGHTIARPTIADFQKIFCKTPFCLLIWGEGGSGKTSLACQLAQWVLEGHLASSSAKHPMLPVLLEYDLDIKAESGDHPLLEAIRKQVNDRLRGEIGLELLRHLLQKQRLLVIVDHFSELSPETRERIQPGFNPRFSINAMVVTSRQEEKFKGSVTDTLKPLRIQGTSLSYFMEVYLIQLDKRELYDDAEFFAACFRLVKIVGQRNLTVLLARLFADQMIDAKEDPSSSELPNNIPDLMLEYINLRALLNRGLQMVVVVYGIFKH